MINRAIKTEKLISEKTCITTSDIRAFVYTIAPDSRKQILRAGNRRRAYRIQAKVNKRFQTYANYFEVLCHARCINNQLSSAWSVARKQQGKQLSTTWTVIVYVGVILKKTVIFYNQTIRATVKMRYFLHISLPLYSYSKQPIARSSNMRSQASVKYKGISPTRLIGKG